MKQFQYVSSRTGTVFGPYDEDEVREMDHRVHHVLTLPPGQTWTDHEGDVWTQLPDVGDEPQSAGQARKERRERIATAALAGMNAPSGASARRLAVIAIERADALIAALDASE